VTPNWQCQLPGFPYPGPDPNGFMLRHEIVDYIDAFVRRRSAAAEGVTVKGLHSNPQHGFTLETSDGLYFADQVVIAAGGYQIPVIPRCAERLNPDLVQINSAEYRNPEQLRLVPCWSWAVDNRAARSPRICTSPAARCICASATRRAYRGATAARTWSSGCT